MSYFEYDDEMTVVTDKTKIDGLALGDIKMALYYSNYVGNLSARHREYLALTALSTTLGFRLSDDLKTLIVPSKFEVIS